MKATPTVYVSVCSPLTHQDSELHSGCHLRSPISYLIRMWAYYIEWCSVQLQVVRQARNHDLQLLQRRKYLFKCLLWEKYLNYVCKDVRYELILIVQNLKKFTVLEVICTSQCSKLKQILYHTLFLCVFLYNICLVKLIRCN